MDCDPQELAKRWLLALIEDAPLDRAAAIANPGLTRDAPLLCEAIARALSDDEQLRRLEAGGALEPLAARVGELAAAEGLESTMRAVHILQSVIWDELRAELPRASSARVFELGARLALVSGLVRAAALRLAEWPRVDSSLWRDTLGDRIHASKSAGSPLSLLCTLLEDADRIEAVELASASSVFARFAAAVQSAVRSQDILACEPESRAWVVAVDTTRAGALELGKRIVSAVEEAEPWRGVPLVASVGLAVLGEDGNDAEALIDAAEREAFAVSARGV